MMSDGQNLQVYAHYGDLPDAAYGEVVGKGEGISGRVHATGQALLIEDIDQSEFASSARHHTRSKSLISAPILIEGLPTGVINVHGPGPGRVYDHNDLNALRILSHRVGRTVQVSQLQSILHSRFATMSLAMKQRQNRAEILANQAQDPGKLAKILAKSFYRELRRAGFGSAQIINAASEIISELGTSLRKKHP
jgi:GAF domain-containing protein